MILFIDLYFLVPPVVTQIFNPIAELVIPIGIPAIGIPIGNQKLKHIQ